MKKENKNKHLIIIVGLVFIIAIISGGIGYKIGEKRSIARRTFQFRGRENQPMTRDRTKIINGEVVSIDDKSITIKMADGSSKIILLTDKTIVNKAEITNIADLTLGEKVMIFGTDNSDGSISATNIQLNPQNASAKPNPFEK